MPGPSAADLVRAVALQDMRIRCQLLIDAELPSLELRRRRLELSGLHVRKQRLGGNYTNLQQPLEIGDILLVELGGHAEKDLFELLFRSHSDSMDGPERGRLLQPTCATGLPTRHVGSREAK